MSPWSRGLGLHPFTVATRVRIPLEIPKTKLWYYICMEKIYLDETEKLWTIENFLTEEELSWFKKETNDLNGWYPTMRSPYRNILNKFLNIVPEYDETGNIIFPNENSKVIDLPIFSDNNGIWNRLDSVLPPGYKRHATLQTFKYMTDEEIQESLNLSWFTETNIDTKNIDFAMYWHQDPGAEQNIQGSFSLYLNDDFEGGELEFANLPIEIKPKAGLLVGIPDGEKYQHRVKKVLGPNSRHTLYGNSFVDVSTARVSTKDDC